MTKPALTLSLLQKEAKEFCETQSKRNHKVLIGVTDGKAVGTYVEQKFKTFLESKYRVEIGNSAKGIDLPSAEIMTDIKVTSITQPQSSCPFKSARQKIFGLGYNLLVFVYEKQDSAKHCTLNFKYCAFIDKSRTADYTTTKRLREMINDGAIKEDIIGFLEDHYFSSDESVRDDLAKQILNTLPKLGYLAVGRVVQYQSPYRHILSLNNDVDKITNYIW